jgi:hypothetical protein
MNVTADAVDHGTSQAATMRDLGQNVAPDRDVLATAVIEYDHFTLTNIIDVVADRAHRDARRAIKKGPRTPCEAELRIPRRNSPALSHDPQPVQRVAQGGRLQPRSPRNVRILTHRGRSQHTKPLAVPVPASDL